jgi:glycosyltransferase involved in cell wall biosynthesis
VSDRVAFYSWRRLGLDPAKMLVMPNPARITPAPSHAVKDVARARLGLPAGTFVFLNVASFYPPKAQLVIVEALARLVERGMDAHLACVGPTMDDQYRDLVENRVRDLGLLDRVTLRDHTDEIDAWYTAADAFVLPSYWEGWSLALNEAVSFGLPLVLSRVGCAEEVAATAGAELVEPPFGEVDELDAQRVASLVGRIDAAYVARLTAAMAKTVERPSPPRPDAFSRLVSPELVFEACTNVLGWIAQGGSAAAARPWTFQPWRAIDGRHAMRAFGRSRIVVD